MDSIGNKLKLSSLFILVFLGFSVMVTVSGSNGDSTKCEVDFELEDINENKNTVTYEYSAKSPVNQSFILASTISGENQSYILRKRSNLDESSNGEVSLNMEHLMNDGRLIEDLTFATASFAFDECGREVWLPKNEIDKEIGNVSNFETNRYDRIVRRE